MQITVRMEHAGDEEAIAAVVAGAFPTAAESGLVDALRKSGKLVVSLVAVNGDRIAGHIAFSPVSVEARSGVVGGLGLAPVAVVPALQNKGIGTALVTAGLRTCRDLGTPFVVVLGEPKFYRRFGFRPAAQWQMANEYSAQDEFMALELEVGSIPTPAGMARYAPEFASL